MENNQGLSQGQGIPNINLLFRTIEGRDESIQLADYWLLCMPHRHDTVLMLTN